MRSFAATTASCLCTDTSNSLSDLLFVPQCVRNTVTVLLYRETNRTGLRPTAFPPGVPVYSGHFHKPHTVGGSSSSSSSSSSNNSGSIIAGASSSSSSDSSSSTDSSSSSSSSSRSGDVMHCGVRYIGSPYQTGIAEAGQDKELLILSSTSSTSCTSSSSSSSGSSASSSASSSSSSWTVLETVPIRLGKRYFRVRGDAQVSAPLQIYKHTTLRSTDSACFDVSRLASNGNLEHAL
jgi:hypothetical protein